IRCIYEIDKTRIGIDLPVRVDVAPPVEIAKISANPYVIRRDFDRFIDSGPALTLELINHRNEPFRGNLGVKVNDGSDRMPVNLSALGNDSIRITAARLLSNFNRQGTKASNSIDLSVANSSASIANEKIPLVLVDARVNSNL